MTRPHRATTGSPRGTQIANLAFGRGDMRWRGKLPIPQRANPLVRELIRRANEQLTTLREISERSGIARKTLSGWRYDSTPNVASLEAALNVIGFELCIRKRKDGV